MERERVRKRWEKEHRGRVNCVVGEYPSRNSPANISGFDLRIIFAYFYDEVWTKMDGQELFLIKKKS